MCLLLPAIENVGTELRASDDGTPPSSVGNGMALNSDQPCTQAWVPVSVVPYAQQLCGLAGLPIDQLAAVHLASYPGRFRGKEKAWYNLLNPPRKVGFNPFIKPYSTRVRLYIHIIILSIYTGYFLSIISRSCTHNYFTESHAHAWTDYTRLFLSPRKRPGYEATVHHAREFTCLCPFTWVLAVRNQVLKRFISLYSSA